MIALHSTLMHVVQYAILRYWWIALCYRCDQWIHVKACWQCCVNSRLCRTYKKVLSPSSNCAYIWGEEQWHKSWSLGFKVPFQSKLSNFLTIYMICTMKNAYLLALICGSKNPKTCSYLYGLMVLAAWPLVGFLLFRDFTNASRMSFHFLDAWVPNKKKCK